MAVRLVRSTAENPRLRRLSRSNALLSLPMVISVRSMPYTIVRLAKYTVRLPPSLIRFNVPLSPLVVTNVKNLL
jgi:hypothetical protein